MRKKKKMMNEKVAILTDSGSDVPKEIVAELGIFVLPLQVNYKARSFRDGVEIDAQTVYEGLETEVPTTSLPLGSDLTDLFEKIKSEGYTRILGVLLSSGLSGTHNMVRLAASDAPIPMEVLDTKNIGIGSGMSAIKAAQLAKAKVPYDEIVESTKRAIENTKIFFVLSTLEYLKRGGRIGKVSAMIGSTFDIKPIITCNEEGIYTTVAKARGRKQSLRKVVELALEYAKDASSVTLSIAHGNALDDANSTKNEMLDQLTSVSDVFVGPVSPALGVHTGPGLIGICVQKD
jgi:DegV family protein with EDD domain